MKELIDIQSRLNAPRTQFNKFGNYKYRSCEDVLEALKPLLKENNCVLTISDKLVEISGRFYIEATARIINSQGQEMSATAYAREEESKKGMDASQLTGSTSSYARKYALNGLFCIDDNKDADASNKHGLKDENTDDNLLLAKTQLREAKTIKELEKVWNDWSGYHSNEEFKRETNRRKAQLTNNTSNDNG